MSSTVERLEEVTQRACSVLQRSAANLLPPSTSPAEHRGDAPSLVQQITALDDDALSRLMSDAARGRAEFDTIITVAAGVAAKRSERSQGQAGLAQRNGHRDAVRFVQSITGSSRGDAARQVRLGGAMGEADAAEQLLLTARDGSSGVSPIGGTPPGDDSGADIGTGGDRDDATEAPAPATLPWNHPVTSAVGTGVITPAAGDAIVRGLGGPSASCDSETLRVAALEMLDAARTMHVDELFRAARRMRDEIDPAGVEERWQRRYDNRSWTMRRNNEGQLTAHVVFDDESGVFATQLLDIALSPRRGGPRFISEAERSRASKLIEDPRTNEQLAFDTMLDVLRCGAECDESTTFRTHRPAVRVLVTRDEESPSGIADGIGHLEGSDDAIPLSAVEGRLCDAGSQIVIIDSCGNPLDLGREQRLFSAKQRTVLRARDGGCLWPECDSPAWACEAHHNNTWCKDHGRTDVADGVLLCKFHHLLLHNKGWKIERDTSPGGTRYVLIPPTSVDPERVPIELRSKSAAWIHHRHRALRHRLTVGGRATAPPPAALVARR